MRNDGQRPPTPLEITEAATDHRVQTRAFPASGGLDLDQMATAILSTGYQPHQFKISEEREIFVLALKTYLRAGIPVIARVRVDDGDLHAITLAGFRYANALGEKDIAVQVGPRTLRSRGVERWYVHDDRLGPYARLGFVANAGGVVDHSRLELLPLEDGFEDFTKPMTFSEALVPLYPKLRLTAEELVEFAFDMLPPVSFLVGEENANSLYVEPRFSLGGDYVRELYARPIDAQRIVSIATTMLTSRYIGVLSWFVGTDWICDVVYDTTDLRRDMRSPPPILGIVPRNDGWPEQVEKLRAARLGPRPVIG